VAVAVAVLQDAAHAQVNWCVGKDSVVEGEVYISTSWITSDEAEDARQDGYLNLSECLRNSKLEMKGWPGKTLAAGNPPVPVRCRVGPRRRVDCGGLPRLMPQIQFLGLGC
jgi:hypothetical protein